MRRRNKKRLIRKPPFYWSLIFQAFLVLMIIFELVILIQNRAWSQNYVLESKKLRDQAEKLIFEKELISKKIGDYYSFLNNLNNSEGYEEVKRVFLPGQNITFRNNQ
jgi:hypothetical protein